MTSLATKTVAIAQKDDFPVLSREVGGHRVVYLDSAATSLRPRSVLDAMRHYYEQVGANIHRGKHYLSEEASEMYEEVRHRVADLVGAHALDVVFVRNTTEALNLVAAGLGLQPSDVVVAPIDAHHSNLLPWRERATLELVPVLPGGDLDMESYAAALRREPAVVALSACSNVTGVYPPLAQLASMAKSAGAAVVVDAAQALPHRIDAFREPAVDLVAFSAHKMLGPTGVGVLCGRHDALDRLRPPFLGGGTVDWVDADGHRLRKIPYRFEYGTPDIAAVIGFGAAIAYLEDLGADALREHDVALAGELLRECAARRWVRVVGDDASLDRAGLVSIELPGMPKLEQVARALSDGYGVMCRSGHMCAQPLVDSLANGEVLRLSTFVYSSSDDLRTAFTALDELRRTM